MSLFTAKEKFPQEEASKALRELWEALGCPPAERFYPVNLFRLAELKGWKIDGGDDGTCNQFGDQKLGHCDAEQRLILYNTRVIGQNQGLRNLTIAHELGHALLHASGYRIRVAIVPERQKLDPKEREADIFARELLMPAKAVRRRLAVLSDRSQSLNAMRPSQSMVKQLADFFGVHETAMQRRLKEVGALRAVFPS
jgi:IrrE N-terminal-like domain